MTGHTTFTAIPQHVFKIGALAGMSASFRGFLPGVRRRDDGSPYANGLRAAHRWGKTRGKIAFHGGTVEIERPRLRGFLLDRAIEKKLTHRLLRRGSLLIVISEPIAFISFNTP